MPAEIPIRNVYYLLCYAWDRLTEGGVVDVSELDGTELVDLYAITLVNGVNHLLRRGLDQGYQAEEGELAGIRGRIDIEQTSRRMLATHGRAYCHFDELLVDTLPNRIIKAAMRSVYSDDSVNTQLRRRLRTLLRRLGDIGDVPLTKSLFQKVQLHSNNRFYSFLLSVCQLIQESMILDEVTGRRRFRDFIRDDKRMAALFEGFVYNFLRIERPDLAVSRDQLRWMASSVSDPALDYLPTMKTDISVRDGTRSLVIDTKFYREMFKEHYGRQRIDASNLYQIYAYLKNLEARDGPDADADGMLLYPAVTESVRLEYAVPRHNLAVCTLNLAQDWQGIRHELLALVANYRRQ